MTFSVIQIAQKLRVVTVCSHPFYFELRKLLRRIHLPDQQRSNALQIPFELTAVPIWSDETFHQN